VKERGRRRFPESSPRGVATIPLEVEKEHAYFLAQQRRGSAAKDFLNFYKPVDLLSGMASLDQ